MMQGDAYYIPITGTGFSIANVSGIEFVIGGLTKLYPGTVTYVDGVFHFPLSQEETYQYSGIVPAQARVKFTSGDVIGATMGTIDVAQSMVRTVL